MAPVRRPAVFQLLNGRGRVVAEGNNFRVQARHRGEKRAWFDMGITPSSDSACWWAYKNLGTLEPSPENQPPWKRKE